MTTTTELDPRDVCFALVESLVNGVVMRANPSMELINTVMRAWYEAGGPEALRAAKPDVIEAADEHWVTMSRSILKQFDIAIPGIGKAKLVAMHLRVFMIVGHDQKNER